MKTKLALLTTLVVSTPFSALANDFVSITDSRFGAIANDGRDDSQAIQNAINYALANKKSVYIPAGTFNVLQAVDVAKAYGPHNAQVKIYGEQKDISILETNSSNSIFKVAHGVEIENLTFKQSSTNRQGKAIEVEFASYRSNFTKLDIIGFDKGIYGKWMIWDRFQDLFIYNVNVGIEFHSNGENPAYWNTEPNGWFNNVNVIDNVYVQNADIGMKLAAMGTNIVNSTVQGSNVGIEIFGPTSTNSTWNNSITNFYAEGVKTVFKVRNSRSLDINSVFVQGGSSANRNVAVIDAENAQMIKVNGMTGQDWWQNSVILKNSNVEGHIVAIGGQPSLDENSTFQDAPSKLTANVSLAANKSWVALPESFRIDSNSTYRLTVSGLRDGYEPVLSEFTIFNWTGAPYQIIRKENDTSSRIGVKAEGGRLYLMLDFYGGGGLGGGKATLEKVH